MNIPFVSHCISFPKPPQFFRHQSSTVKFDIAQYLLSQGHKYNCKVPSAFHPEESQGDLHTERRQSTFSPLFNCSPTLSCRRQLLFCTSRSNSPFPSLCMHNLAYLRSPVSLKEVYLMKQVSERLKLPA